MFNIRHSIFLPPLLLLIGCQKTAPKVQPIVSLEAHTLSKNNLTLTIVTFDRRNTFLTVADKPDGPNSLWPDAKSAAQAHNAVAAINGGFFDPKGNPLGLVISNGITRGSLHNSHLGAALYLDTPPSLITRDHYRKTKSKAQNLLQAGPTLLWNSTMTPGLKSTNPEPRSFLLWDGHNHLALGHASSATLSSLAETLSTQPIPNFNITHALNLDGGTSSDLWVASSVKGGGLNRRSWLNKPARNYLILTTVRE